MRQLEIISASNQSEKTGARRRAFTNGARWADETMLNKAEDWFYKTLNSPNEHGFEVSNIEKFIADFRKSMKE